MEMLTIWAVIFSNNKEAKSKQWFPALGSLLRVSRSSDVLHPAPAAHFPALGMAQAQPSPYAFPARSGLDPTFTP